MHGSLWDRQLLARNAPFGSSDLEIMSAASGQDQACAGNPRRVAVGEPRAQMLGDEALERRAVDLSSGRSSGPLGRVYRPSIGVWHILQSSTTFTTSTHTGLLEPQYRGVGLSTSTTSTDLTEALALPPPHPTSPAFGQ
jgi:hypothetical protein